ncbi:MAG: ankyrin repeat domain-containing protein, partial [Armatimonadota bacterium]|nr:ankyrin repeat domain-containing protein [Armatimonadota bacterium]
MKPAAVLSSLVGPVVPLLISYTLIQALDKLSTKDMEASSANLRNAARRGEIETAAILLRNGTDVEARDKSGRTPLMHAAAQGQVET